MAKADLMPINGVVEPDFLEYLARTFDSWKKLNDEKVALGTREISKFQNILFGAKLNARFGFEVISNRGIKADGKEHYTILIYRNREAIAKEKPLYSFSTIIYR